MIRVVALLALAGLLTSALPTTLLSDAHTAHVQAKRAREVLMFGNQQNRPADAANFYQNIKKRSAAPEEDDVASTTATVDATDASVLDEMRKGASDNSKTVAQYEKGYQYGVGKDALQKQAENSLLKSDIYGDPATNVNEFRYYGGGDGRTEESAPSKRSVSYAARLKRDLELDPESLMALIALWQTQRNRDRGDWTAPRYGYERLEDNDISDDEEDDENQNGEWYENPVTPGRYYEPPAYRYPPSMKRAPVYYQRLEKKRPPTGQWGGFIQDKRFMVSKRRQADRWDDPMLARLLATQPRDTGLMPQRRILL